ncbi:hypothetical protein [Blastopirellula marina]|uniref:Uncharacterized protein n=1 Tax=Blastopirellula marina TaxID=124 RepID=A0A2S8FP92_9BACT|nr:hypothetical protein [Blastopirellula marina]PQO33999.1 hypothetical protein C5Y98_17450 [Blastopirellula marina]PTL43785.1 hypothetical protein C5Y97_17460 [Blastopirellula marina]
MWLIRFLVPHIRLADLPLMFSIAVLGGLIAGGYGIAHDQVTYSISPEYFTKMKFDQFHHANFGWGDRVFAGTIGFLATWWAGMLAAWLLARRLIPNQPRQVALRQIGLGIGCIFVCVILFGLGGYLYGLWRGPDADYSHWQGLLRVLEIDDQWAFIRVAYIHNAGYMGVLLGLIVALALIRPRKPHPTPVETSDSAASASF